jgi:hypothetical protein
VSNKHIIKEPFANNSDRTRCDGVILTLRPATAYKHGENNKPNGDPFEFSCREIKLSYLDVISLDFPNKIEK